MNRYKCVCLYRLLIKYIKQEKLGFIKIYENVFMAYKYSKLKKKFDKNKFCKSKYFVI